MRISDWSSDVCSSDLTSDSLGRAVITLTFEQGTDADTAQVQVQNKLQLATARLPREVQQSGLIVAKATNSILLAAAIYSEDGSHSVSDMADYVASRVQDPVSRVPGVGDIRVLGGQYALRIWALGRASCRERVCQYV